MAEGDNVREQIGNNAARLDSVEHELGRVRDRQHEMMSELAALRYLGNKVGDMAEALHELSGKLEVISRRALERPSARSWQAFAATVSAGLALVALIVAVTHSH